MKLLRSFLSSLNSTPMYGESKLPKAVCVWGGVSALPHIFTKIKEVKVKEQRDSLLYKSHIPHVNIAGLEGYHSVTDREEGVYLGHPDSILLDDGTLCTFYPKGHGKGEILFKTSNDEGRSWSKRLPLPESFKTSMETPTVYRIESKNHPLSVLLVSGNPYGEGGFRTAWSYDNCKTFTEMKSFYDDIGTVSIVAHASLTKLKDKDGSERWMGIFHDREYNNWKTFLTLDADGKESWSRPERLLAEHDAIEKEAQLCEIEIVRSPDGQELALLARAQRKMHNAMIAFSTDEGETWSCPKELPRTLMGERHKACYTKDQSRLVITFRDIIRNVHDDTKWLAGNFIAWVGCYEDLRKGKEGDYTVRLGEDFSLKRGGDCGYAGLVLTENETFVATTYGHWDRAKPEECYVRTSRFTLTDLDRRAFGL